MLVGAGGTKTRVMFKLLTTVVVVIDVKLVRQDPIGETNGEASTSCGNLPQPMRALIGSWRTNVNYHYHRRNISRFLVHPVVGCRGGDLCGLATRLRLVITIRPLSADLHVTVERDGPFGLGNEPTECGQRTLLSRDSIFSRCCRYTV